MKEIVNASPAMLLIAWSVSLTLLCLAVCVIAVTVAKTSDRTGLAACLREIARIVAAARGKGV